MPRLAKPLLWIFLTVNLWVLLAHLVVNRDAGGQTLFSPEAALTSALLLLAPALVFLPIGSLLAAPFYDVEAILGWGTLGFVLVFFTPDALLSHEQFLALVLPLTVALASLTTLVAYAFVRRVRGTGDHAGNILQARRVGYLAALAMVTLALLSALDVLTPFNGTLVIAVAALSESLVLASRRSPQKFA